MKQSTKIAFGVLILLAAIAGYGVYWWYGAAGSNPGKVPAVDMAPVTEIRDLVMKGDLKSRSLSRKRLDMLKQDARVETLFALCDDKEAAVRLFAVSRMVGLRDLPRARALLARLAQSDPDKDVRKAAESALAGGG